VVTLALAGCDTTGAGYGGSSYGGNPYTGRAPSALQPGAYPQIPGLVTPGAPGAVVASTVAPSGRRVALLVPLTGPNADRGQALAQAAKLALDQPGAPAFDVLDTHGTPDGAATAASAAISAGAGLILGPLTNQETAAAAVPAMAAGVGVLAFTSDPAQAHPGVWVLGLTPAQQVRRLVTATMTQGRSRFAALLPPNDYGRAMSDALTQAVTAAGGAAPDIHTADSTMQADNVAVRDLSDYANRRGPIDAQIRAARAKNTPAGRKEAAELIKHPIPPPPFDVLLLAATGEELSQIASLLPYYDIDQPTVRVLGPALWANPSALGGARLNGAWYAAPDPAARSVFAQQYAAAFGAPPPGLADIAYDAAAIARVVSAGGGFSAASLTRPEGFAGVDGVLGLLPDGTVRRGLALFELQRGGPQMIEPAPDNLGAPGT
jgi:ABC-type branched-subunit amino acid transport system substrate-binding protein